MGRPKIAFIDDSEPQVEEKKKPSKTKGEDVKLSADQSLSEQGEDGQKAQALTSVTPSEPVPTESRDASLTGEQSDIELSKQTKKAQKPGKAKPRSKKYQEMVKDLDKTQTYPLNEAIELIKKSSYSKFTGSLEAHINTSQTGIRGLVSLPFASGKKLTILAFGSTPSKDFAEQEGVILGDDEIIEEISKGKVNFDLVITTPEWMAKLAKTAKILGPRGLMPNPKNGTITSDLKKAVEGFQTGKTEYKTEAKSPILHMNLGKLDQPTEELAANAKALLLILGKSRIKKVTLSPTMGPSVKVNPSL